MDVYHHTRKETDDLWKKIASEVLRTLAGRTLKPTRNLEKKQDKNISQMLSENAAWHKSIKRSEMHKV